MEQPPSRAVTCGPLCSTQLFTSCFTVTFDAATNHYILNFDVLLGTLLCLFQHRLPLLCCPIYLCGIPHGRQNVESLKRGAIAAENDPRAAPRLHEGFVAAGSWDEHSQGPGTLSQWKKEGCDKAFAWNFVQNLEQKEHTYSQDKLVVGECSRRCVRWVQ